MVLRRLRGRKGRGGEEEGKPRVRRWELLRRLFRDRLALAGLIVVLMMFATGIFAPWLAPYSYRAQDLNQANQLPSWQHLLGTDELGRDQLSRIIWGARTACLVSVVVVSVGVSIGVFMGALAGYFGGWVDAAIMRLGDILFAFPGMLFILILAATIKPRVVAWVKTWEGYVGLEGLARSGLVDYVVVMLALSLVGWPGMARLVRGQFLTLRELQFVEAAQALGASPWRIIRKHILPNAMGPVIVALSLGMGGIILSEASLSFLGVGIQPPNASWGSMIAGNYLFWRTRPHMVIVPGLVLAAVVFAFNFLGDGLNRALSPRER